MSAVGTDALVKFLTIYQGSFYGIYCKKPEEDKFWRELINEVVQANKTVPLTIVHDYFQAAEKALDLPGMKYEDRQYFIALTKTLIASIKEIDFVDNQQVPISSTLSTIYDLIADKQYYPALFKETLRRRVFTGSLAKNVIVGKDTLLNILSEDLHILVERAKWIDVPKRPEDWGEIKWNVKEEIEVKKKSPAEVFGIELTKEEFFSQLETPEKLYELMEKISWDNFRGSFGFWASLFLDRRAGWIDRLRFNLEVLGKKTFK